MIYDPMQTDGWFETFRRNLLLPYSGYKIAITETILQNLPNYWQSHTGQEIPRFLWEPNFHYRLHNRPHAFDVDVPDRLQLDVLYRDLADYDLSKDSTPLQMKTVLLRKVGICEIRYGA
jgi:hypothetical protein